VVQGAILAAPAGGWTFRLDLVKELSGSPPDDRELLAGLAGDRSMTQPSTLPHLDHLDRLAALEQALRANGQWWFPHPWLTTFVGDATVEPVVAGELAAYERVRDAGGTLYPGQRLPDVARRLARPLRDGVRPAQQGQGRA
jgi:cytokinin dehydrogenase